MPIADKGTAEYTDKEKYAVIYQAAQVRFSYSNEV